MSETKYYNFDGIAYWAKVDPDNPDEYLGVKKWNILVKMDEENRQKVKNAGLDRLKLREIGDGYGYKFACDVEKEINGKKVTFDPPKLSIWNNDTKKYDDFEGNIGNESRVRVNVSVYDTRMGKGHRLLGVSIFDLVDYVPDDKPKSKTNESAEVKVPW